MAKDGEAARGTLRWGLVAAFVIAGAYVIVTAFNAGGDFDFPIDDAFIFCQFARNTARGYIMTYTVGEGPTGGCTSVLWMLYLAAGWLVGLRGKLLPWFAGISCGALLVLTAAYIQKTLKLAGVKETAAAAGATLACLVGPVATGYFSGTDTALFSTLALATAYYWVKGNTGKFAGAGAFLSWARPEGAAVALTMAVAFMFRRARGRRRWAILLIPAAAAAWVGFMYATTGDFRTNSYYAKSPLAAYPGLAQPEDFYLWVYWRNPRRALRDEMTSGLGLVQRFDLQPTLGPTTLKGKIAAAEKGITRWVMHPLLIAALGLGLIWGFVKRPTFAWGVAIPFGVLAVINAAVLGDEHFFYQRCRYGVPLLILAVVAGTYGVALALRNVKWLRVAVTGVVATAAVPPAAAWLMTYADNVSDVHRHYGAIVEYINAHLPEDAVVTTHDAGYVAYYSKRRIIDFFGLGARRYSEALRTGEGGIFEEMEKERPLPTHIVFYAYRNAGLESTITAGPAVAFIQPYYTDYYETLMYRTDFSKTGANRPLTLPAYRVSDALDVADLESEKDHRYRFGCFRGFSVTWRLDRPPALPIYEYDNTRSGKSFPLRTRYPNGPEVADAGRLIAEWEEFRMKAEAGRDGWLVLRTDRNLPPTDVYVNGVLVGRWYRTRQRWQPPGTWLEPRFPLPGRYLRPENTIRLVPAKQGWTLHRVPFHYWLVQ